MRDVENDDRKVRGQASQVSQGSGQVSRYAPPHHRAQADEATILPVLERLSRGEAGETSHARADAPEVEPIRARPEPVALKLPLSATGRLAVAMGLLAAATTVSIAYLQPKADRPAAAQATPDTTQKTAPVTALKAMDAPRTVHTVTIRPQTASETTTAEDTRPSPASEPAPLQANALEQATALTAPLTMWSMFPDTAAASGFTADAPNTEAAKTEAAKASEPAKDVTEKSAAVAHKPKAKRTTHRVARHRTRHRRVRTAAKPQPPQQTEAAAQTSPTATQPAATNPIQAALDSIFHGGANSADSASGNAAPATTGAAFR